MFSSSASDACFAQQAFASLDPLLCQLGIDAAWMHGSRAAGFACDDSDWDFCVNYTKQITLREFRLLKASLRFAIGQGVDLCSPQSSDPVFLRSIQHNLILVYQR